MWNWRFRLKTVQTAVILNSVLHNPVINLTVFSVLRVRRFTVLQNIQFETNIVNARDAHAVKHTNSLSSHMDDL